MGIQFPTTIKGLNEFRNETKTQIRDLNNTITRFMQTINQRMEEISDPIRRIEDIQPIVNTSNTNNYQHRSMKIDVLCFDGTNVSGWVFKIE